MNYEARLRRLEHRLMSGRLLAIPLRVDLTYPNGRAEQHSEPPEEAVQRYLDNGGAVPRENDLVVLIKKFTG